MRYAHYISDATAAVERAPAIFSDLLNVPISFDTARAALCEALPMLSELDETPQDPLWHAEGDVATHTRMVCEELEETIARGTSACGHSPYWTAVTRLGALLHDIAKPVTTREDHTPERVRVIAPHHAHRGASYVAYRLLDAGCPHRLLLDVLELVRLHHDPKRLVLRDRPPASYRALAMQTPLGALYDLEMADMRGRQCEDREEQIELIELFRLGAEEAGAFDIGEMESWLDTFTRHIRDDLAQHGLHPARVARGVSNGLSDYGRSHIYTPHEAVARELARPERFCQFVLMVGPSGSGKSELARAYQPIGQGRGLIALDALRAEMARGESDQSMNREVVGRSRELLREALRAEVDVVFDATSLLRDHRAPLLGLARDYHAHTTIAMTHVPPSTCFAQNAERKRSVPTSVLSKQLDALSWPVPVEAHALHLFDVDGRRVHGYRVDTRPHP